MRNLAMKVLKPYCVTGCIDGTQIAIRAPSENDQRFAKAAYWCRKHYYALNAMVVSIHMLVADGTLKLNSLMHLSQWSQHAKEHCHATESHQIKAFRVPDS